MIPQFPEFKKLELSDRADVEKFTSKYDPYSDFNFVEMWSWDLEGQVELSSLNKNLVIRPNDLFSNKYSLSYLGNNNIDDTLEKLFAFLTLKGESSTTLRLIPEVSLSGINLDKYIISIDINNCDYVYDLHKLSDLPGSPFVKKRNKVRGFLRNYEEVKIRELDMSSEADRKEILDLNNKWVENRIRNDAEFDIKGEPLSLDRFLQAGFSNLICVGLYHQDIMIGYSVFSTHSDEYAIGHFTKANGSYKGIYEYFLQGCANVLLKQGLKYLNYQEDMGLLGLRMAKNSYRPVKFMRKYSIEKY